MGEVELAEKKSVIEVEIDKPSVVLGGMELENVDKRSNYNWTGANGSGQGGYNWSYKEYMRQQEEEEMKRVRKMKQERFEVITIDED